MATNPDDIELEKTCEGCPEQYDATLNGEQVGYLRLRGGLFYVECPDCSLFDGDIVYEHHFEDDPFKGEFNSGKERAHHLRKAREAIAKWVDEHPDATRRSSDDG